MKSIIIIFFSCCMIVSCGRESEFIKLDNGLFSRTEQYESGNKKSQQLYRYEEKNGYVPEGYFMAFYENGILADSVGFVNGKKEGIERTYYESGKKKSSFFYRNGNLDSFGVVLYQNGQLAEWHYRSEGIPWGVQSYYDSLGKLNNIVFASGIDSATFVAYVDENGNVTKMSGTPIYVLEKDHKNIKVGLPFSTMNFVPEFGKYKAKLRISIEDNKKQLVYYKETGDLEYELNGSAYFVNYVFGKAGNYTYKSKVMLYDTISHTLLTTDSVQAEIVVR